MPATAEPDELPIEGQSDVDRLQWGRKQFRVGSRGRIADVESRPSFGVAKRSLVDHMPPLQACLLEDPREKERGSRKCAIGAV